VRRYSQLKKEVDELNRKKSWVRSWIVRVRQLGLTIPFDVSPLKGLEFFRGGYRVLARWLSATPRRPKPSSYRVTGTGSGVFECQRGDFAGVLPRASKRLAGQFNLFLWRAFV